MPKTALLVLENPWDIPADNSKRLSMLPFLQGLERLHPELSVYYSTFYEKAGFKAALECDLVHTKEPRQILYIGSHGNGKNIAFMTLKAALKAVKDHHDNIEGVLVSSCDVTGNVEVIKDLLVGTNITWVIGYNCSVNWFESSLIDLALLNGLITLPERSLSHEENLIKVIKGALNLFDKSFHLGEHNETKRTMKDSIEIIIQARGQGKKPKVITQAVFA